MRFKDPISARGVKMTVTRIPSEWESPLEKFERCFESVQRKSKTVQRFTKEYRQEVLELHKTFEKWYATL